MAITHRCIDKAWEFKSILLDFIRFKASQYSEAVFGLLHGTVQEWELEEKLLCNKLNNAADIMNGVGLQRNSLTNLRHPPYQAGCNFFIRCVSSVINLAAKGSMRLIHGKIDKIQKFLRCTRCSIKKRDLFNVMGVRLVIRCKLTIVDVETRFSATFEMIQKRFLARHVLSAAVLREKDVEKFMDTGVEQKVAEKCMPFLNLRWAPQRAPVKFVVCETVSPFRYLRGSKTRAGFKSNKTMKYSIQLRLWCCGSCNNTPA